jgi:hypothetical protein
MVMVFNATFNNISIISWRSVLLVEETEESHRLIDIYNLKYIYIFGSFHKTRVGMPQICNHTYRIL